MEAPPIPQQAKQEIKQIDSADLVVGIFADLDQDTVALVCNVLRELPDSLQIVVLRRDSNGNSAAAHPEVVEKDARLSLLPWSAFEPNAPAAGIESIASAYQSVFAVAQKLGARSCCLIASKLETATLDWIRQLAQPLLEEFDLVAPYYARRKFEGLLNNSIIYPLARALYGKRVHHPMGPDLGISRRLFEKMVGNNGTGRVASQQHPLASLLPMALCNGFRVGQVHIGARVYPPTDWTNISSLVAQVLGLMFSDMEKNAACWQRVRGSAAIPAIGAPLVVAQESGTVDVSHMVNSFQLGNQDLQEIWRLVLPPATLLELRKLARLAPDQFQMPDDLWARIVYDFALGFHLRTINRDHLLRSMTPLYLGWVASYARELENAGTNALEQRLERLSLAYETSKPYLVSRWRWPDRFNP